MYFYEKFGGISLIQRIPYEQQDLLLDVSDMSTADVEDALINYVQKYYQVTLKNSKRAQQFLMDRGLLDQALIDRFQLGFSDRTLGLQFVPLPVWQSSATRGTLQLLGLLKPSGHEFFRGSLIFPFLDERDRIAGAYGRRITQKLKAYSVYHVHWVSEATSFYNLKALSRYKHVFLCKSPLEALTLIKVGMENVVALMGAKSFSAQHVKALKTYGTECLGILFDDDVAHRKIAAEISRQVQSLGIQCYRIKLPKDKDVNQFYLEEKNPKEAFAELIRNAISLTPIH